MAVVYWKLRWYVSFSSLSLVKGVLPSVFPQKRKFSLRRTLQHDLRRLNLFFISISKIYLGLLFGVIYFGPVK